MDDLKVVKFIKSNENWRELLSSKPYFIEIKEDEDLILLKYNQIESDFNNEIVRECRGLIITSDDFTPVCIPFFKFGNYGEGYSDTNKINWTNAKVLEKLDGSLIKVFYYKKWRVATNGSINAFNANIVDWGDSVPYKSFGDLFIESINNIKSEKMSIENFFDIYFKPGTTYMFELTSPYNKVVVPHDKIKSYFIGTRDNITYKETYILDHPLSKVFSTPKIYDINSLQKCIEVASELPFNQEGYVVTDTNDGGYFYRIKVKSPAYLAIHHLKGEGIVTPKRMINLILTNESDEFLNYFPEYKELYDIYKSKYDKLVEYLDSNYEKLISIKFESRKDLAYYITKELYCPGYFFSRIDNKISDSKSYLKDMVINNLLTYLEKF